MKLIKTRKVVQSEIEKLTLKWPNGLCNKGVFVGMKIK